MCSQVGIKPSDMALVSPQTQPQGWTVWVLVSFPPPLMGRAPSGCGHEERAFQKHAGCRAGSHPEYVPPWGGRKGLRQ